MKKPKVFLTGIIIKFLAHYENWMEKFPQIDPKPFSKHPSAVDFEQNFIQRLHLRLKDHPLKFESKNLWVPDNVWIAELLNFMRGIKKLEWKYLGRKFPFNFPYQKIGERKIESDIKSSRE